MSWSVLIGIVVAVLAENCLAQEQTPVEWSAAYYPNPTLEANTHRCGRFGKTSFICDPNHILDTTDANQLESLIEQLRNQTPCACSRMACRDLSHGKGYQVGVALMEKMMVTEEEKEVLKRMNKEQQASYILRNNLNKAALFSYTLMRNWHLGKCNNSILILYSLKDNMLYTSIGSTTKRNNNFGNDVIAAISMSARKYFGKGRNNFEGLQQLVTNYRDALNGHYYKNPSYMLNKPQPWIAADSKAPSVAVPTVVLSTLATVILAAWL